MSRLRSFVFVLLLWLASCGPQMTPGGVCAPGATQSCLCADGMMGVQTCDESGARWGMCGCVERPPPPPVNDAGTCSGTICNGQCIDTSNNNAHCGACARACTGSQVCVQGTCTLMCGGSETACGSQCVNTRSDRNHCGSCGRACGANEDCSAGTCVPRCPTGQNACSGTCVNLQTDARNCGACGVACSATQRCNAGVCMSTSSSIRVEWQYPGLWSWMGSTDTWLPTYVTHLMGVRPPVAHDLELEFVCASVTNSGSSEQRVDIELRVPSLASPVMQSAMVRPGMTTKICPTPAFLPSLRSLRAEQPGSLEVYARLADGTEVSRAMRPFTATASNAVLWGRVADIEAMGELSTVFVTPNDPAVAGLRPAVEARSIFPGGFGGGAPYERANYLRNDTLSGGFYLSEFFYLRRGSRVSWQLQSVTGSGSPAVDVYAFTIDQFVAWRDSGGTMAVSVARDQRTGATGSFVAPSDNGYVFVLFNRSGSPSRTVVWTRSNTGYDVARDALSAIFLELRARGMRYTNLATSYFVGWQNVRRPAESLAMRTANCIDGTFLFASILESAGMRPYIVLVPGHAFVAVAMGPDPDDPLMPIETTMVGSAATADEAIWCALGDCPGNRAMPRFDIDVTAARRAGIRPIPTL